MRDGHAANPLAAQGFRCHQSRSGPVYARLWWASQHDCGPPE